MKHDQITPERPRDISHLNTLQAIAALCAIVAAGRNVDSMAGALDFASTALNNTRAEVRDLADELIGYVITMANDPDTKFERIQMIRIAETLKVLAGATSSRTQR